VAQAAHFRQNTLFGNHDRRGAGYVEEFGSESEEFLHFVWLVINEAAALACSTPYPHLFLPALVDEKLQYARNWANRQRRVGNGLDAAPGASRWEADDQRRTWGKDPMARYGFQDLF